jgi:hypothetical protein
VSAGKAIKVLLASSEIPPFAKTGGLADVCEALPKALRRFKERELWHKLVLQHGPGLFVVAISRGVSRALPATKEDKLSRKGIKIERREFIKIVTYGTIDLSTTPEDLTPCSVTTILGTISS